MSIDLFEHNRQAYDSACEMLSVTGKACVVHPTGTGKSFIGFKLCEDDPEKTGCWLNNQRNAKCAGKLSDERIKLLDDIGMIW